MRKLAESFFAVRARLVPWRYRVAVVVVVASITLGCGLFDVPMSHSCMKVMAVLASLL